MSGVIAKTGAPDTIWLAKRKIWPMPSPWVQGGRFTRNDSDAVCAARRKFLDETRLDIAYTRFQLLQYLHDYSWSRVEQGEFPGRNMVVTCHLELSEEEIRHVATHLKPTEYDVSFGLQPYDHERLISDNCHPMLADLWKDIFGD